MRRGYVGRDGIIRPVGTDWNHVKFPCSLALQWDDRLCVYGNQSVEADRLLDEYVQSLRAANPRLASACSGRNRAGEPVVVIAIA